MSPLASLGLATAVFVGSHLILSHPLRDPVVQRMGERGFLIFYSAVSVAAIVWMTAAWRAVPPTANFPLWIAPSLAWWAGSFVVLFALILLVGALRRNPAFPHPGAAGRDLRAATGVFAITRHPMNWAFILWALVHIGVWGTPRNLIVAGGILILAVFGSIGQDRKKLRDGGGRWRAWMDRTSFLPFAAVLAGRVPLRAAWPGRVPLLIGLVLWLLITWWHAPTVSVIAMALFISGALL